MTKTKQQLQEATPAPARATTPKSGSPVNYASNDFLKMLKKWECPWKPIYDRRSPTKGGAAAGCINFKAKAKKKSPKKTLCNDVMTHDPLKQKISKKKLFSLNFFVILSSPGRVPGQSGSESISSLESGVRESRADRFPWTEKGSRFSFSSWFTVSQSLALPRERVSFHHLTKGDTFHTKKR